MLKKCLMKNLKENFTCDMQVCNRYYYIILLNLYMEFNKLIHIKIFNYVFRKRFVVIYLSTFAIIAKILYTVLALITQHFLCGQRTPQLLQQGCNQSGKSERTLKLFGAANSLRPPPTLMIYKNKIVHRVVCNTILLTIIFNSHYTVLCTFLDADFAKLAHCLP